MHLSRRAAPRLLRHLALLTLLLLPLLSARAQGELAQGTRIFIPLVVTPPAPARVDVWTQLGTSVVARPGDQVRMDIFVRNTGSTEARGVRVSIPFNRNLATFYAYSIDEGRGDRFLGVDNGNTVLLELNRRIGPGKTYGVSLWFTARTSAPDGSVLSLAANYAFAGQSGRSNTTTTYIYRQGNVSGGFCGSYRGADGRFTVTPESGASGTRFTFVSDCFLPGEEVVTWLNIGTTTEPLALRARANAGGRVVFQLDSRGLSPSDAYGFVGSGRTSGLTILGPFIIGPTALGADELVAEEAAAEVRAAEAWASPEPAAEAAAVWPDREVAPALEGRGIVGTVTGEGGAPLAGVIVTLFDGATDVVVDSTRTDAAGNYTLAGIPDGAYTIAFLASFSGDPAVAAYASRSRSITVGAQTTREDASLSKGGFVTGRVVAADAGATPLEGVSVFFLLNGTRLAGVGLTDESGVYTSTALPAGNYTVVFDPQRSTVVSTTTYLKATTSVSVTPPATRTGVDAALQPSQTVVRIGGRVTAQDTGLPLAGVVVVVSEARIGGFVDYAVTDALGFYQTSLLPPGSYVVRTLTSYAPQPGTQAYVGAQFGSDVIQLTPGFRNDVNFALVKGSQVSGRVTGADTGRSLAGVRVRILDGQGKVAAIAETNAFGTYLTSGLADGAYTAEFSTRYSEGVPYFDLTRELNVTTSPEPLAGFNAALPRWPNAVHLPVLVAPPR